MINIVLYEPEIPQNAGNVARLCACVGAKLIFIGKLGFSMSDKYLKRSGMDYWADVELEHYTTFDDFKAENSGRLWFFETGVEKIYTTVEFQKGDNFIFGPESRGLPAEMLSANSDFCVKIPLKTGARSLNVANSCAIAAYEAVRQLGGINP